MRIDIKTIVVHCKSLAERKESIISQLDKNRFRSYEFYTDYDASELDKETIDKYYNSGYEYPERWDEKINSVYPGQYHPRQLNMANISLCIKFGKIFEKLIKEDFEYCLIFEDDALLVEDFADRFLENLKETPDDWDAIYIGSGAGLKPETIPGKVAYLRNHPATKCTDSILIKKKTIMDLSTTFFPFSLAVDWELAYQHFYHKHNIYWWEPSLVVQGSESGRFKSALR